MKKKHIIAGLLAAALLTGCGEKPQSDAQPTQEDNKHTHTAQSGWKWNGTDHWQVCECGETMNTGAHDVNDRQFCKDCGVEVWTYGDGTAEIWVYNDQGDLIESVYYDERGKAGDRYTYEYEHDQDGNVLLERSYCNGKLDSEYTYVVGSEGLSVMIQSVYYSDGERVISQYDEDGNRIYDCIKDKKDNILSETLIEYAMTEDGEFYIQKETELEGTGAKNILTYNEHCDWVSWEWYDEEGQLISVENWEYAYDEQGQMLWLKEYVDGVLVHEIASYGELILGGDILRYEETVIDYWNDGSYTIINYDENGEVVSEVTYDFEGNVID